ncbi:hypothetical protein D2V93_10420 [Flagellimonas taeanensis]|nr:hypothetical protein D2V93_10420 [Allomuricauda taeanensis]
MTTKNIFYFSVLIVLSLGIGLLSKELLNGDNLLIESLSNHYTIEQIEEIINFQKKWEFTWSILVPLILLIKISIIAVILDTGCFLMEKKIQYGRLFGIVLLSEFIFLVPIILKTLWFHFFQKDYTLEDLQYFYPFSALNIVGHEGLDIWWVYPLQTINVFEITYWIVLAYLLDKALKTPKKQNTGIKIVASSYGTGLLIWVIGIMFFTLSMG